MPSTIRCEKRVWHNSTIGLAMRRADDTLNSFLVCQVACITLHGGGAVAGCHAFPYGICMLVELELSLSCVLSQPRALKSNCACARSA